VLRVRRRQLHAAVPLCQGNFGIGEALTGLPWASRWRVFLMPPESVSAQN
jgi:hypothetical protein